MAKLITKPQNMHATKFNELCLLCWRVKIVVSMHKLRQRFELK